MLQLNVKVLPTEVFEPFEDACEDKLALLLTLDARLVLEPCEDMLVAKDELAPVLDWLPPCVPPWVVASIGAVRPDLCPDVSTARTE